MSPIDPGRMRHRLRRVTMQRVKDGAGGFTEIPQLGDQVWAEVRRLSGDVRVRAMQTHAEATHEIRTWVGPEFHADECFQDDDGRVFKLVAPPEDEGERGELLVVLAQEEVS